MSDSTGIEWTDATWNPVTGCTRVSPGCAHCYIERTPPFRMEGRRFSSGKDGGTTGVRLHPERLEQPLRWRKPRRVFVNSLSDLFHEDVPFEFIARVYRTMALATDHTFQVLTKRPDRAREWFEWARPEVYNVTPLPNVWLGVSIENARFTWRADVLREVPAAVRFISAEPLLGSLFEVPGPSAAGADPSRDDGDREDEPVGERQGRQPGTSKKPLDLTGIDWVIVGGESGPGARPMHPDWAREIRDACLEPRHCPHCGGMGWWSNGDGTRTPCVHAGVTRPAFFFKQWGGLTPKAGGKLLDGREWCEWPEPRARVAA